MVTLSHTKCPRRAVVAVLVAMLLALTQCWWQSRAERRQRTRHPRGTSDSMGTHDQVLGFLTQRDWWQRVARSPWQPWPGHCTQRGCGDGPDRAVTCGTRCLVTCAVPGSARPCGGTCPMPHCVLCHILCHIPPCATFCAMPWATSQPCHVSHRVVPHAQPHVTSHVPWQGHQAQPGHQNTCPQPPGHTQGQRDTTSQWPIGQGQHFISFCHCTKIKKCHVGGGTALLCVPKISIYINKAF